MDKIEPKSSKTRTVHLPNGSWSYDPSRPLGKPGGFGTVFEGVDKAGRPVAVKHLHVNQGQAGHRELRIAAELAGHEYRHVIPIFDSGADSSSGDYFVVMARAGRSLADELAEKKSLPEAEAINILLHIVDGLEEIDQLIHRDLKPENILLHEGQWKIADLGIARFVEESTSLNTLKECLSPLYAAPEQWELAPVSKQTDVYALGCILYALITGTPPFTGATEDLHEKHLSDAPPILPASPRLRQLANMCLRKVPAGRPDLPSVRRQLQAVIDARSAPRHDQLAAAGAHVADEIARRESQESCKRREEADRRRLAQEAISAIQGIFSDFNAAVSSSAPVAQFNRSHLGGGEVILGQGKLLWGVCFPHLESGLFPRSKWDVVCGAYLAISQQSSDCPGRSANLWYMRQQPHESYRWWEISYMSWSSDNQRPEPFGLAQVSEIRDADLAASQITHNVQFASPLVPIDGEHLEAFIQRWAQRLASAAIGSLRRPSMLPER